jgi:hypothetical protein
MKKKYIILLCCFVLLTSILIGFNKDICIISVSEKDESKFGLYPWSKNIETDLLEKIEPLNPKIIVFPNIFTLNNYYKNEDKKFIETCKMYSNIILGAGILNKEYRQKINLNLLDNFCVIDKSEKSEFYNFEYLLPAFRDKDSFPILPFGIAVITHFKGILTKSLLVVKISGDLYPSLGVISLAKFFGYSYKDIIVKDGEIIIGNKKISVIDNNGLKEINFNKYDDNFYTSYSFVDILSDNFKKEDIENKIVIVGYSGNISPISYNLEKNKKIDLLYVQADIISTLMQNLEDVI